MMPVTRARELTAPARFRRTLLIIVLGTIPVCMLAMLPVLRGTLQSYYGISLVQLGVLYIAGAVPAAALTLLAGTRLDRLGWTPFVRLGLAGGAAGLLLAAAGWRFPVMVLAAVIIAASGGVLSVAVPVCAARTYPDHPRFILSLHLALVGVMNMMSSLAAEGIIHIHRRYPDLSLRWLLHLPYAAAGVLLLAGLSWFHRKAGASTRVETQGVAAPLGSGFGLRGLSPGTVGLTALLVLHGVSDWGLGLWLPRILDSGSFARPGLPPGIVVAGAALAYVVSRTLLGFVPEHRGWRLGMLAPGPLGGGLMLAGILSRSALALGLCYIAGSLLWAWEYPVILARAARDDPRRFGAVMALSTVAISLTGSVLGMGMGWAGSRLGDGRLWMMLIVPACGFVMVGVGAAFWLMRFGRAARPVFGTGVGRRTPEDGRRTS